MTLADVDEHIRTFPNKDRHQVLWLYRNSTRLWSFLECLAFSTQMMNPAGGMHLGYIGLLQWVKCWQFVHNLCCQWPRMVESLRGGCSHLVPCFSRQNGGIDLERKSWRSTVYRQFPPELCRNVNPAPKLLLGDYKEFEDGLTGFERK